VVYAGVDYGAILEQAQKECDVLVWDGGNNDFPFYRPDVWLVVADPLRAGHEFGYHPGETNFRAADVIVINKIDSATPQQIEEIERSARTLNPDALVIRGRSPVSFEEPIDLAGKRVLVIEDGPTLTHGEMQYGAGVVAARGAGVAEIVDPREFAVGSMKDIYDKYEIGPVLPAMGYSGEQLKEFEHMINSALADAVIIATPIDLRRLVTIDRPAVRVFYDLEEAEGSPTIADALRPVLG
jgi:predicted GTPase